MRFRDDDFQIVKRNEREMAERARTRSAAGGIAVLWKRSGGREYYISSSTEPQTPSDTRVVAFRGGKLTKER